MKRRSFLKLGGLLAASGLIGSCGQSAKKIIPYLIPPDEGINPVDGWFFATTCRVCDSGCGIMVRTVEGRAKKIEGNPNHPINFGGTCARGQAAVQQLYHPDRIKGPLKRVSGGKGIGKFQPISWEEASSIFSDKIKDTKLLKDKKAFIMSRSSSDAIAGIGKKLLAGLGDGNVFVKPSIFGYETFIEASSSFNAKPSLPFYDIEQADFVFLLGADIFESGFSPVYYGKAYGEMRGRDLSRRGVMVYAGTRLSLTASNADNFIGIKPGSLGLLVMGVANEALRLAVNKRLLDHSVPTNSQERWINALKVYTKEYITKMTGVKEEKIERIAARFVNGQHAVAVAGDEIAAHSNGLDSVKGVEFLNLLSKEVARGKGSLKPPSLPTMNPRLTAKMKSFFETSSTTTSFKDVRQLIDSCRQDKMGLGIIMGSNPVYTLPSSLKAREALSKTFVVYIGNFLNETTEYSDLILPDHHFLESWSAQVVEYPEDVPIFNLQQPVVNPLYDTHNAGDILIEAANKSNIDIGIESTEKYIKDFISNFRAEWAEVSTGLTDTEAWEFLLSRGGRWPEEKEYKTMPKLSSKKLWEIFEEFKIDEPVFTEESSYTFHLHPYRTITTGDGDTANIPWLQEMPEPMTTLSWGSWVEINPATARDLGIREGDILKVESPTGSVEIPAFLFPGIAPDVVAIPFGYGPGSFGGSRQDIQRANPFDLISDIKVKGTEAMAWRASKVRIKKVGKQVKMVRAGHPKGEYHGSVFQL